MVIHGRICVDSNNGMNFKQKKLKHLYFWVFVSSVLSLTKIQAQCNVVETISICDMTQIDSKTDGTPDGIINLYDAYNAISGVTPISSGTGMWYDPNYNFALDETNGDLYLWDLDNSSMNANDYQFQFLDSSSGCPNNLVLSLNVVIGPFEGNPLPPSGPNDANITTCEAVVQNFDLFQVFESLPSPHKNGIWAFVGNLGDPANFISLSSNGKFDAQIPYVPGGDLIEFDVFEFTYTVSGMAPCSTSKQVNIKVEVIRDVQSGSAESIQICEEDMLLGMYDDDINLRDDRYLIGEDIEGLWSSSTDPTGQISDPLDSSINLREIYDELKLTNPRFGCQKFTYSYTVEARSSLTECPSKTSNIEIIFFEAIRPLSQTNLTEYCADGSQPDAINLYDLITFTTENGVLYDYPNSRCTNWQFISGPSDLGLSNAENLCDTVDLRNLTNTDAGTYVFQYTILPTYNCNLGSSPCTSQSANITVIIHPKNYAGEDTSDLEFCETEFTQAIDLLSLLDANGIDDPIYSGALGAWEDLDTGNSIVSPFNLPTINNQQTFNFRYNTTTNNGCEDQANLSFTVFEQYDSGIGGVVDICEDDSPIDLFSMLTGSPNTTGYWTTPEGLMSQTHSFIFDPETSDAGDYIYTVPENSTTNQLCTGNQTTITVVIHEKPNAGDHIQAAVCRSQNQIDLFDFISSNADLTGSFSDIDGTNTLSGNTVDVSQLTAGTYNFEYQVAGNAGCTLDTALIQLTITEVEPPVVINQTFCATDGATVTDLQVDNAYDYYLYDSDTSTTTLFSTDLLEDGKSYYVTAVDENGCESIRIKTSITVLPINHVDCDDCLKDGVSDNGDGLNDELDLCSLPITFPNFEIHVFNRNGTIVYKGKKGTPYFNGVANVSLVVGSRLPSGVYFYVFNPNNGSTPPFQGNFYLSR